MAHQGLRPRLRHGLYAAPLLQCLGGRFRRPQRRGPPPRAPPGPVDLPGGGRRPGDPATLIASPERIIHELGWSPRFTDIHAIAATAWRWHSTHPQGYGSRNYA